jgi:hypothetical protein
MDTSEARGKGFLFAAARLTIVRSWHTHPAGTLLNLERRDLNVAASLRGLRGDDDDDDDDDDRDARPHSATVIAARDGVGLVAGRAGGVDERAARRRSGTDECGRAHAV